MATMDEFKRLHHVVRTISGWKHVVSHNAPIRAITAQIIYVTKSGDRKVFGEATAKTKAIAIARAYAAALDFFNAD